MYHIEIDNTINKLLAIFHQFGMWRNGDEIVFLKMGRKLIYLIFHVSFFISLASGCFLSDDKNESTLLGAVASTTIVLIMKLICILWKKKEILALLRNIVTHSIADHEEFVRVSKKLKKFKNFIFFYLFMLCAQLVFVAVICLPVFSAKKRLPLNIGFPSNWKNSEIVYWLAVVYLMCSIIMSIVCSFLTIIIWYIMINCSINYEKLEKQFKCMGEIEAIQRKFSKAEKQKLFLQNLIDLVKTHRNIKKYYTSLRFDLE